MGYWLSRDLLGPPNPPIRPQVRTGAAQNKLGLRKNVASYAGFDINRSHMAVVQEACAEEGLRFRD